MDKRESPTTIHLYDALKAAVKEAAQKDGRTVSTWVARKLESDPTVQIVLQQIGERRAKS